MKYRMRVDRHHDPIQDLEDELIDEIEGIAHELGGIVARSWRHDSTGRSSKVIEIEYDIQV